MKNGTWKMENEKWKKELGRQCCCKDNFSKKKAKS